MQRGIVAALAALVVSACQQTYEIPRPPPREGTPVSTVSGAVAAANQSPIRLDRVVTAIPKGEIIGRFPRGHFTTCNAGYRHPPLQWEQGVIVRTAAQSTLAKPFFDAMREAGYNMVGDPAQLFDGSSAAEAAEFLVGARIVNIESSLCAENPWGVMEYTGRYSGEMSMRVQWELYSVLARRVIHKLETTGFRSMDAPHENGLRILFEGAFVNAAEKAGDDPTFRQLVSRNASEAVTSNVDVFNDLVIVGNPHRRQPIVEHVPQVLDAVVTIRPASGHGSGFVVSENGYILTNAHVVGEARQVPVEFNNGVRVNGEVVRMSKRRDVALVKVPLHASNVLPLATSPLPRPADEVYVVGSPHLVQLKSTVTKGIVSAVRQLEDGNLYIQADVAITPGNSGGPLLDDRGNVVGITVAAYSGPRVQNLNFFVPIGEALQALNIEVSVEGTSSAAAQ